MRIFSPADARCPDLIVLVPAAGFLHLFAFTSGLRGDELLWRETAPSGNRGDVAESLPGLLARHAMRLETPTTLVASAESGGFLLVPGLNNIQRNRAWVERQLDQALPFSPKELLWRTRAGSGLVEIFWLPAAWVKTQKDMLARFGLRLGEIYPRAALFREEVGSLGTPLIQEADALHVFEQGMVRRSASQPAEPDAADRAEALERMALGKAGTGVSRKISLADKDLPARVLALWRDGSEAIFLTSGRWAAWAPVFRLSAIFAALAAVAVIGLVWQNDSLERTSETLRRDYRKLAPLEKRAMELERSVSSDRKLVSSARLLDNSPMPLDVLKGVTAALPDKLWVQRMHFKDGVLELSGRGGDGDKVVKLLADKGFAATTGADAAVGTDSFSVRLELTKSPGGPGG